MAKQMMNTRVAPNEYEHEVGHLGSSGDYRTSLFRSRHTFASTANDELARTNYSSDNRTEFDFCAVHTLAIGIETTA